MDNQLPELKVNMLGRFSITYGEQPITFKRNSATKAENYCRFCYIPVWWRTAGAQESPEHSCLTISLEEKSWQMWAITCV